VELGNEKQVPAWQWAEVIQHIAEKPAGVCRREQVSQPPPAASRVAESEPSYDYGYFGRVCI